MTRINTGSVDLPQDDADWLKALCNVRGVSVRTELSQIITEHIVRFKPQYVRRIMYFARSNKLTWEQAFVLLARKDPPYKEEDLEWARTQAPLAVYDEEISSYFGHETKDLEIKPSKEDDIV